MTAPKSSVNQVLSGRRKSYIMKELVIRNEKLVVAFSSLGGTFRSIKNAEGGLTGADRLLSVSRSAEACTATQQRLSKERYFPCRVTGL